MDNKKDQNGMKVEICRKTKFHYDNQTIVNSPPKNDSQFIVFQMVSRYFQWPYFPYMTKIIPGICYIERKININTEMVGEKKELCNADSRKHCITCSMRFPEINPPPPSSFTIANRQQSLLTYCNIYSLHQNYQIIQKCKDTLTSLQNSVLHASWY